MRLTNELLRPKSWRLQSRSTRSL